MLEVRHLSGGLMLYFTFHRTIPVSQINSQVQSNSITHVRPIPRGSSQTWCENIEVIIGDIEQQAIGRPAPPRLSQNETELLACCLPACGGDGIHSEKLSLKPGTTCNLQSKFYPGQSPSTRNTNSYTWPCLVKARVEISWASNSRKSAAPIDRVNFSPPVSPLRTQALCPCPLWLRGTFRRRNLGWETEGPLVQHL